MQKKRYEIDDRKPSVLPKIGTAVVAIGSLASAAAMAAPTITDFSALVQTSNPESATTAAPTSAPNATLPSRQITAESQATSNAQSGTELTQDASIVVVESLASPSNVGVAAALTPEASSTANPASAVTEPAQQAALEPIGSSAGNISSPTPSGSNTSVGASGVVSSPVGNTSSATPGGGYDEDDDDYDDDHDDHEDEDHEDDDHEEDDDDDWWGFGDDDDD